LLDYNLSIDELPLEMGTSVALPASTFSCFDQALSGHFDSLLTITSPAGERIYAGAYVDTITFTLNPGV